MQTNRSFGQLLARLRAAHGLKQEDVANTAGITANYWGKLERGQQDPSGLTVETLASVARAVRANAEETAELFNLAGSKQADVFAWIGDQALLIRGGVSVGLATAIRNSSELTPSNRDVLTHVYAGLIAQQAEEERRRHLGHAEAAVTVAARHLDVARQSAADAAGTEHENRARAELEAAQRQWDNATARLAWARGDLELTHERDVVEQP